MKCPYCKEPVRSITIEYVERTTEIIRFELENNVYEFREVTESTVDESDIIAIYCGNCQKRLPDKLELEAKKKLNWEWGV